MSEPTVRHDPDNDRYVIEIGRKVVGTTQYHLRGGDKYFFYHTEIDEGLEGQGIGSALARFALDDVRAREGMVIPLCPFIAAWMKRHPEYDDLIDERIMERIEKSSR